MHNKIIINRRKFLELFGGCTCGIIISSCSSAPITGRKQLRLIPESTINSQSIQMYEKVKKKLKLSDDKKTLNEIKDVGRRIEDTVSLYYDSVGKKDPTYNFRWEYILIDNDKIKNAWCMPGGKIAVYTGILKITKNIDGLAAIMGHEIAHAVAKHSIERASRALVLNVGTQIADIASGGTLSRASRTTGIDVSRMLRTFGIDNPFGRKQETEADYLGLIFSSLAGFDIRESVKVWERMQEEMKGQETPEWMSTHPSSLRRIENLKKWIPEITVQYPPIKKIG
ncbi:MAG: Zn-dependent protease with chaperone function [Pelagibacterales bacterium]|nr:Zn-dependent protease with chaperone function [Pelagibacterales bacterium]